jgi:hypothetical protein
MFDLIAVDMKGSDNAIIVGAVNGVGEDKGRDYRGNRLRAFDVLS